MMFSPASTFAIISSLIAVPVGILEARHAAEGLLAVGSFRFDDIALISCFERPHSRKGKGH